MADDFYTDDQLWANTELQTTIHEYNRSILHGGFAIADAVMLIQSGRSEKVYSLNIYMVQHPWKSKKLVNTTHIPSLSPIFITKC